MPVPQSFSDARIALRSSRDDTARKLFARTTAQQNLDAALRLGDPSTHHDRATDIPDCLLGPCRGPRRGGGGAQNAQQPDRQLAHHPRQLPPSSADAGRRSRAARFGRSADRAVPGSARDAVRRHGQRAPHSRLPRRVVFSDIHEREMTPDETAAATAYWDAVSDNEQESAESLGARRQAFRRPAGGLHHRGDRPQQGGAVASAAGDRPQPRRRSGASGPLGPRWPTRTAICATSRPVCRSPSRSI